jgi:predicted O-methyltransferase YrrM
VGTVPVELARDLRRSLSIDRAVETGTWVGGGALLLSDVFRDVTTIELSEAYARNAAEILRREPIRVVHGDSRAVLQPSDVPTFYFLDGHWSGGDTAEDDQCPLLDELAAIAGGHPDDCVVIDDARLFAEALPPGHRRDQWPTLEEVERTLSAYWPEHVVVVAHDQIAAVPARAAAAVSRWAETPYVEPVRDTSVRGRIVRKLRRLARRIPFVA